ncbi:MAG TPA: hypothetical protein VD713_06945 [Sphingomonadales bacterium]|nr:hypothetical protein [Sphingomonadales bacterium]
MEQRFAGTWTEKRTLKISFVRDVLGNFVLAIPFWAIGFSLTGGIQDAMSALTPSNLAADSGAAVHVASALCTSADTLTTACAQADIHEILAD